MTSQTRVKTIDKWIRIAKANDTSNPEWKGFVECMVKKGKYIATTDTGQVIPAKEAYRMIKEANDEPKHSSGTTVRANKHEVAAVV